MNKTEAKLIAQTINIDQLKEMFANAESKITNWEQVSRTNKQLTKGAAWNILKAGFESMKSINDIDRALGVKNMIWEFGDYLDDSFRVKKDKKPKQKVRVYHEDPYPF